MCAAVGGRRSRDPGKENTGLPQTGDQRNKSSFICRCGGIGRHKGLKIPRSKIRTGSIPVSGTNTKHLLFKEVLCVMQDSRIEPEVRFRGAREAPPKSGYSDPSEWPRSARDEGALSPRTFAGHRNRTAAPIQSTSCLGGALCWCSSLSSPSACPKNQPRSVPIAGLLPPTVCHPR